MTLLIGLEGIGKSSLGYALALSVALGRPFLDRPTTRLPVLYFDSENSCPDASTYLRQLWIGAGCPEVEQLTPYLRLEHFSLAVGWQEAFLRICKDNDDAGLLIIDTANSCFSIKDENSNAEAAEIVTFVQRTRPPRAAVLILKHERDSDGEKKASVRGAKYWLGSVDQYCYLHRMPGRPPSQGLHRTRILPAKRRAWGLDEPLIVEPEEIKTVSGKGLIFHKQTTPPS